MSSRFILEEFLQSQSLGLDGLSGADLTATAQAETDAAASDIYEKGYQAGWDDAVRASADDQARIGVELGRNLQDLGFTFHEARVQILRSLEQLLTEIASSLLPALIADLAKPILIEQIESIAKDIADLPIEIVVAPGARAALEPMLTDVATYEIRIAEEPSLAEGQVFLRAGDAEKFVNYADVFQNIVSAVSTLYDQPKDTQAHG